MSQPLQEGDWVLMYPRGAAAPESFGRAAEREEEEAGGAADRLDPNSLGHYCCAKTEPSGSSPCGAAASRRRAQKVTMMSDIERRGRIHAVRNGGA